MHKKGQDKRQKKLSDLHKKKILENITKEERQNPEKPYTNITKIHKEIKLSRRAVKKHVERLITQKMVFRVNLDGKTKWIQSRFGRIARNTYEESLKNQKLINAFLENRPTHDIEKETQKAFTEKLVVALAQNKSELCSTFKRHITSLKELRVGYFSNTRGKYKLFIEHPNLVLFPKWYSKVYWELEETIVELSSILYNEVRYPSGDVIIDKLKDSLDGLFTVTCRLKGLVELAVFLSKNLKFCEHNKMKVVFKRYVVGKFKEVKRELRFIIKNLSECL